MGDSKYNKINTWILSNDMEKTLFNLWLEWFVGFSGGDANFQVFPSAPAGVERSYLTKNGTETEYYILAMVFIYH